MHWPDVAAWTGPHWAFVIVSAVYVLLFVLFCRLLLWKWHADRHYWRRLPQLSLTEAEAAAAARGELLPFVTLLVPARNEADVIGATVRHLAGLNYPSDRFEIVVITDAREDMAAAADRAATLPALRAWLRARCHGDGREAVGEAIGPAPALAADILLALLARLVSPGGCERQRLVLQAAVALGRRPRAVVTETARRLRRLQAGAAPGERAGQLAAALGDALAVHVAAERLQGRYDRKRLLRVAGIVAKVRRPWSRELLAALADARAGDGVRQLAALAAQPAVDRALADAYCLARPTTRDKLAEAGVALAARGGPALRVVTVPPDFDGRLGGACVGKEVPSTKGRALNWGLAFIRPDTAWCGFFDAESRPHRDVLLYIASRHSDSGPSIYQGPVFQVRNFFEMGPFSKIASLYQSVAHEWVLPVLFRRLPFVGGTNLFVRPALLRRIGGFDPHLLTEDLELGTRAYLAAGEWPVYLPYPSSEQTPPTVGGFFRQRLRWGAGHLQVVRKVWASTGYEPARRRRLLWQLWRKGQLDWIGAQLIALVPPVSIGLYAAGLLDPVPFGLGWRVGLHALSAAYFGFTLYAYRRYRRHMDSGARAPGLRGRLGPVLQLALLPLAAFLFPAPYSAALVLSLFGAGPRQWFKTPRTPE